MLARGHSFNRNKLKTTTFLSEDNPEGIDCQTIADSLAADASLLGIGQDQTVLKKSKVRMNKIWPKITVNRFNKSSLEDRVKHVYQIKHNKA